MHRTGERFGVSGLPHMPFTSLRHVVGAMWPPMIWRAGLLLLLVLSGVLAGAAQPSAQEHLVPVPSRVDLQLTPIRLNPSTGLYETTATGSTIPEGPSSRRCGW